MTPERSTGRRETPADVIITIGPDGLLRFHDLSAAMLEVAAAMNPTDEGVRRRAEAARRYEGDDNV